MSYTAAIHSRRAGTWPHGIRQARDRGGALAHVDDTYYYGAYCRKCKHSARLSLVKLRAHLGDGLPLVKVKDRLRCERCNSRQIVISFLAPNQRTGNVAHLFGEEPRGDIRRQS
jgi:hypothetical protein